MADIRATCPNGHTHRTPPHNMHIHIRDHYYRWLCPPCGHWVDQPATIDTITMLHEFGVPGIYDPNARFRALTPDVANREIAAFDPDLLLTTATAIERLPHGGDEADLERAADQLDTAVDWMRDQILYHLDITHPGHPLGRWRDAQHLDPWALAETIHRRCPARSISADLAVTEAHRINDHSNVYADPGPWVEQLAWAAIDALRAWPTPELDGMLAAVNDAFTLAAQEEEDIDR